MTDEEKAPNPGPVPVHVAAIWLVTATLVYLATVDPLAATVLATIVSGIAALNALLLR